MDAGAWSSRSCQDLGSCAPHRPMHIPRDTNSHRNTFGQTIKIVDMAPDPDSTHPYQIRENDERWTAVDKYALKHLHTPDVPYYKELEYAAKSAESSGLPDIAVSALQGQFLAMQCRLLGVKHALEVGTLGAYSTIWLATASPDIKITSIEINEKHAEVARKAIENAGLTDRIDIIVGAGVDVIPKLASQIKAGERQPYDFVFIDADKPNNLNYLNASLDVARSGAEIIVDNVVRKGKLASAEAGKEDPKVQGCREVVEGAGKNSRLHVTLMQTVGEKNYDGFLICMVK